MVDLAKGVRDFSIEEMQVRSSVIDTIREQFTVHGFIPLETPILERLETLNAKMTGSEAADVAKEIFKVDDQGGRDLGLRYDLTVPLARYVAMHKDLKMPFRRSEIGRVYRDGPIKLGRYREFIQCDADIVGASSLLADAECLLLAEAVFTALDIPVDIHVNDRRILDAICLKSGVERLATDVIISIDKLAKIGESGVRKELAEKGVTDTQADALFALILLEGTNEGKLAFLRKELGDEVVAPMRELLSYVEDFVQFTPSLARGLAYYTGTIFEAFAQESVIKSSLMGGGRYDNLIGVFGGTQQPAVGVSFGIEPICEVVKERQRGEEPSTTRVFIAPIGNTLTRCVEYLRALRKHGVPAIIDLSTRSISKNMEYAQKLRIPYVLIVGENDLEQHLVTVKELATGEERRLPANDTDRLVMEFELR
jgi:histidyl-tRNA synthetase